MGAEDLGLSLAESKTLLATAQQRIVTAQVNDWLEQQGHYETSGCRLHSKGSYPLIFHTLFGDVRLQSPRFYLPKEPGSNKRTTISPLTKLIPVHVAPERLYLETKWASLVSYAAASDLMSDVLPITSGLNATTVRQHTLRVAERIESDLTEQRYSPAEGTCPRDWQDLPVPDCRITMGLDGGYIRDWDERKKNFELIVGRAIPTVGDPHYVGFVHGYDAKPRRRIVNHLNVHGMQINQDITFITDGGEEVRGLAEQFSPCSEHVLDWFHITMRITVMRQFALGLIHYNEDAGNACHKLLKRIKWFLWHGNALRAVEEIDNPCCDLETQETDYPNIRKFAATAAEFRTYIAGNTSGLINYGERCRSGERISSAFAEATVNAVISKRFAKKQQMQWTRRGAHMLLQTRVRALDGTLRATFKNWYPGMKPDNDDSTTDQRCAA